MRGNPLLVADFQGGVDTKAAPFLVRGNECRDCRNVLSTTTGSIKKRNGNQTFCSSLAGSPTSIQSLFGLGSVGPFLIATAGTKMYSVNTSGTSVDITGAASLTNNARWEFIEGPGASGPLYGMNGTDTPKLWTGSGNIADWTASAGAVPNGKYVLYFKNRVFVVGTASNPSRLYACAVGDPRNWDTTVSGASSAWSVDLDPTDGDGITGIVNHGAYVLVFKRNKIYVIYDLDSGANRTLSTSIGCAAHRSIVDSPLGTFFLTNDKGIYLYNGTILKQLSESITPTLQSIVSTQRQFACGAFANDHYYLSVCTSGAANNLVLDFDTQLGSFWPHSNTANQFALWKASNLTELYAGQAGSGIIDKSYVSGVSQDNGVNYLAYWQGPWITANGRAKTAVPFANKRLRQIHIDGNGIVDVYLATNYSNQFQLIAADIFAYAATAGTFGGSDTFGGGGIFGDLPPQARGKHFSLGVARAFSVQFQSSSVFPMEIDAYTLFLTPRTN